MKHVLSRELDVLSVFCTEKKLDCKFEKDGYSVFLTYTSRNFA